MPVTPEQLKWLNESGELIRRISNLQRCIAVAVLAERVAPYYSDSLLHIVGQRAIAAMWITAGGGQLHGKEAKSLIQEVELAAHSDEDEDLLTAFNTVFYGVNVVVDLADVRSAHYVADTDIVMAGYSRVDSKQAQLDEIAWQRDFLGRLEARGGGQARREEYIEDFKAPAWYLGSTRAPEFSR